MEDEFKISDIALPPQHQDRMPGLESEMSPRPIFENPEYLGSGKLNGKVALITGGDSGIGRAIAVLFAKEGADIAIIYFDEEGDANETKEYIEGEGRRCTLIKGDIGDENFCQESIEQVISDLGKLDILINNASMQSTSQSLGEISSEQLEKTFRTNVFGMFYLTKAALKYLGEGSSIINTTSVTAYNGSSSLIDYSATKGAIVSFTRSLAKSLAPKIKVNAVAPGPVWTPLIPSSFSADSIPHFGKSVPLERPAQPVEIAPAYLFLASFDSNYMTGQVLHPNGGEIVGS